MLLLLREGKHEMIEDGTANNPEVGTLGLPHRYPLFFHAFLSCFSYNLVWRFLWYNSFGFSFHWPKAFAELEKESMEEFTANRILCLSYFWILLLAVPRL
jgi:hypothetical protein